MSSPPRSLYRSIHPGVTLHPHPPSLTRTLTGLARLCTDVRSEVRGHALRDLQRALLVHDLNQLSAIEWESCFNKVLFPLLSVLLESSATIDPTGIEETRFRVSTLLSKVSIRSPLHCDDSVAIGATVLVRL